MSTLYDLVVTCPFYTEDLLEQELLAVGGNDSKIHHGAVTVWGTLETAYRTCLESRIANNVLFPLVDCRARSKEELVRKLADFPFPDHFPPDATFAVESKIDQTFLSNPGYASLVVKDAVVDSFRKRTGRRPDVDTKNPDIKLSLLLEEDRVWVRLLLSPRSLFKRGYRQTGGQAPLKENVAAAILLRAGWPEIAARGGALVDLMCGSGTFLAEGILIALGIAPGAFGTPSIASRWKGHDRVLWDRLVGEARARKQQALTREAPRVVGFDIDPAAIKRSRDNLKAAGLERLCTVERADFRSTKPPHTVSGTGLVVANPPYGERLGESEDLWKFYGELGETLSTSYSGWRATVLCGSKELARAVGLRAAKLHTLYNGPIRCALAHFDLSEANRFRPPAR